MHKGPGSAAVVELVDELMARTPDRWVQILGNHEGQYLDGGTKFWPKGLQIDTAETIRSWWATGRMRVAAAFEIAGAANQHEAPDHDLAIDSCPTGSLLVTHAGLTCGAWRLLGGTPNVVEFAATLNEAVAPVVWREGAIITGVDDLSAGPLWAMAASEV